MISYDGPNSNEERPLRLRNTMTKHTRRSLFEVGWRSLAAVAALGAPRILGQGNSGNRVLVGIDLMGGNDTNNLIVPLDPQTYTAYAGGRGELALPPSWLLPIQSNRLRTTFGMPAEVRELAALYRQQALAVFANVGDLARPITRSQYFGNASAAVAPDASSHTASSKMQFLPG